MKIMPEKSCSFYIGLFELNMDGTLRKDGSNNAIPTHTFKRDIQEQG